MESQKLSSQNGPPFSSTEMANFAESWQIEGVTSSPDYQSSNGLAERCVGIIKKMFQKCDHGNTDKLIAQLNYQNTPNTLGTHQLNY